MAFRNLSAKISGDASSYVSATSRAKRAASSFGSEATSLAARLQVLQGRADEAEAEIDSVGRSAATTSGMFSSLTASTDGLALSFGTLSTVMTLSLIPSLLTLSTVLAPIAAAAGGLVAVLGSIAGVGAAGTLAAIALRGEELKTALTAAWEAIQTTIAPAAAIFADALTQVIEMLPRVVEAAMPTRSTLQTLADQFVALADAVLQGLPELVSLATTLATEFLPVVTELVGGALADAPGVIATLVGTLQEVAPMARSVGRALADLSPTLLAFGQDVLSLVAPALVDLIDIVGAGMDWFLGLNETLRNLAIGGTVLAPAILAAVSALGSLVGPITTVIGIIAGLSSEVLLVAGALTGPLAAAATVVAGFAAAYAADLGNVREVTNNVIGGVLSYFSRFRDVAERAFSTLKATFDSFTSGLSGGAFGSLTDSLSGLVGQIQSLADSAQSTLVPLFNRVMDVVAANQDEFKALGRNVTQIIAGVVDVIRGIVSVVRFVFENYTSQVLTGLVRLFETHFGSIMSEVNETLTALMGYARWFGKMFGKIWSAWGDEIMAVAKFVADLLTVGILNSFDMIISTIRVLLNVIQGDWGEAWEAALGLVERIVGRFMGVLNDWGIIEFFTTTLPSMVLDALAGLFVSMLTSTRQILNRIYNAFASVFNGIVQLVTDAINSAISTLTAGLNSIISRLNAVIKEANKVPGTNLDTFGQVSAPQVKGSDFQAATRPTEQGQVRERVVERIGKITVEDGEIVAKMDERVDKKSQEQAKKARFQ